MSFSTFTEVQPLPIAQIPTTQSDTPQVADLSQSIFVAVAVISSFLLGASKTYLTILPFTRRILPKRWTDGPADDWLEALAESIIELAPALSVADKVKVKDRLSSPEETARLVLAEPEQAAEKLSE